ncbi:MAG: 4-hydroxyacetophenone monooxygenase, partial [Actinomycetota bacterium]|nr:4-hydroxyacetophenone monooxygenase [Actinomycetota bacterium]
TPEFRLGCKRILLSDAWYPALAEPQVEVVTDAIREVRAHSVVTADGKERELDTLILATGFRVTDTAGPGRIYGRGGVSLSHRWSGSPQAYLGTAVAGFPNLFLLAGPNLGPGHTSVVFYIESQVRYILDCLEQMERRGAASVEVRQDVQDAYNRTIQERMRGSVWTTGGCTSWYLDKNGRNTTLWPGFSWELRLRARRFDPESYRMESVGATNSGTPVAA